MYRCFEAEHYYFRGNCEGELRGYPVGFRVMDRRPLCGRCTQIGEATGWAGRVAFPYKSSLRGTLFLMILGAVMALLVMVASR